MVFVTIMAALVIIFLACCLLKPCEMNHEQLREHNERNRNK